MKIILAILLTLLSPLVFAQNNFVIPRDVPGRGSSFVRPAPTYVNARVLAANVSETITLPAGTRIVVLSANCDFYAKLGNTAAVVAADVTDGTASELNPAAYYFANAATATQNLSVISAGACIITAAAYLGRLD